ncbi:hypothetical protein ACIHDR_12145 [Nocardia sp. NPDC052278]|uniref:hypothetical protein n=1 Tax=unclassified Nocardia TaxID=2637762 RepID=UPI00369DD9FE
MTTVGLVLVERVPATAAVEMVLPTKSELTRAAWGLSVEAKGGPAAEAIVRLSHALAELHASDLGFRAELGTRPVGQFDRNYKALLDRVADALMRNLPDLPAKDLRAVADRIGRITRLSAQANRRGRSIRRPARADQSLPDCYVDLLDYHQMWTRLAQWIDHYDEAVSALAVRAPWRAPAADEPSAEEPNAHPPIHDSVVITSPVDSPASRPTPPMWIGSSHHHPHREYPRRRTPGE